MYSTWELVLEFVTLVADTEPTFDRDVPAVCKFTKVSNNMVKIMFS
jgi:hypothetical protein